MNAWLFVCFFNQNPPQPTCCLFIPAGPHLTFPGGSLNLPPPQTHVTSVVSQGVQEQRRPELSPVERHTLPAGCDGTYPQWHVVYKDSSCLNIIAYPTPTLTEDCRDITLSMALCELCA